ncbi:MAG: Ferrochelatase, protoheme ferro-lyase (EC [uncultured Sulfurovum sp.]|uniref:Ferrochelatase n=1 Tax=uncultured Sulfurovum sp. TaxID=269237 RepID=A0A6S6SKL3_9BACT|nr:MAG: Ferrochelatase, protoheme ferro-lyase (EC [uncultured Sulfurovum sp.]
MNKKALLLLNMGGPNNVDEVEMFLRNMFSDKNILTMDRYTRALVREIIVRGRIDEVKENFMEYLGGKSPLPALTYKVVEKLNAKLDMKVAPAMRYVPPFATDALIEFQKDGVDELVLFPMYPQYSTTTTLSSLEDIEERCEALGYAPKITMIDPYYDDYDYVEMCANKIMEAFEDKNTEEYDLLLSAHGLPMSIIHAGDPYQNQVEGNVSALRMYFHERGIKFNNIKLVYQSKVGSAAWLEPNLVDVLRNPYHRKVLVYPLAFTIDNSETVYELDIEHREIADKIIYDDYRVAKCFNDDDNFVDFIVKKVNEA